MTRMLLDAASMYFRAFYGVPEAAGATAEMPTNAIRGFLDMTSRLVTTRRPSQLLACLDASWRPAFRARALPSYKAHRMAPDGGEEIPDGLSIQVPVLMELLDALGIARAGVDGFEADDVIGTAAAASAEPVEVVTGDRDLFQVVRDDPSVRVLYIARGVAKLQVMGPEEVAAKYGIPGDRYADFAVLRGDPSDGLPGVAGVGDKTAAALITRFGSLADMLAATEDAGFPAGARKRIQDAADYLAVAPEVVAVRRDVPLPDYDDRLPERPVDPAAVVALADRYGLDNAVNRWLRATRTAIGS
jgi:5'-3' exonuclease